MNTRQMDKEDWLAHYAKPENFNSLFDDYLALQQTSFRTELSTAEEERMEAIVEAISAKISA